MENLKMHSPDLSQENIAKLRELFPDCVTEARDETSGAVRLAVDFDMLRQELSDHVVDAARAVPLTGRKREALARANAPQENTLRPCRDESVDFDGTGNLFLEGDNFEVLKIIEETYLGAVRDLYRSPIQHWP